MKRQGKVYTEVIDDCLKATIQAIIRGKVQIESVIHSDGWKAYDGLVDLGYKKHYRINHAVSLPQKVLISMVQRAFAKYRLAKFKGISERTFYLHLKECELRFNYRHDNLYLLLLKIVRNRPLKLS